MTTSSERVVFETERAGYRIKAVVERQTQDLTVQVIGGDVPHYGVVTAIQPTGKPQTISLPSRPGHVHQEKVLTFAMAHAIQPVLEGNAMIISGMHVNDISDVQMKAAVPMVQELGRAVAQWIQAHPTTKPKVSFAPGKHHHHQD
jgi:hypothetical protein